MSIQRKPSIKRQASKKNTKIRGVEPNFKINRDLKSVDIEEIYFTDFLKKDKVKYNFVKKEIGSIKRNQLQLNSYEIKEENYSKKNRERIKKIYEETYCATNATPLIRMKHSANKEFQIYCQENKGSYIIQLIDLHHLIVPAADKEHGEIVANPESKYNEVKGGKVDLKDLIK